MQTKQHIESVIKKIKHLSYMYSITDHSKAVVLIWFSFAFSGVIF